MPCKKNNRKAIQKAKAAAQPRPKSRHIGAIGHVMAGSSGLAMAVLASGILRKMEPLGSDFEKVWDDNVDKLYISDEEGDNG